MSIPTIAAGAIAVFWSHIQRLYQRYAFENLIFRELEEFRPFPKDPQSKQKTKWTEYFDIKNKKFIHKTVFENPSQKLSFLLSLDPDLVYFVSQLWNDFENQSNKTAPDSLQFYYYLEKIYSYSKGRFYLGKYNIGKVYCEWNSLIKRYDKINSLNVQSPLSWYWSQSK